MVHALLQLGLSVSYDRVKEIRNQLGNQICEEFLESGVVREYSLLKSTPKAYGSGNASEISSSNTTSQSAYCNRILISVFSFNKSDDATANFNASNGDPRKKLKLPEYYTIL